MIGWDQEVPYTNLRVWVAPQNKVPFDVHKEKGVLFNAPLEFIDINQASNSSASPILNEGPILEIPQIFEKLIQTKLPEKVWIFERFL